MYVQSLPVVIAHDASLKLDQHKGKLGQNSFVSTDFDAVEVLTDLERVKRFLARGGSRQRLPDLVPPKCIIQLCGDYFEAARDSYTLSDAQRGWRRSVVVEDDGAPEGRNETLNWRGLLHAFGERASNP